MSKRIPLSGKHGEGLYALVDDEDYERVMEFSWHRTREGYAQAREKGKGTTIRMHQAVLGRAPNGMHTDHKNGNKLDNTRDNIRVCTPTENQRNRKQQRVAASRFKGVYGSRHAWRACIRVYGRLRHLGCFDNEADAAQAYDEKALELFGEFARTNADMGLYDEDQAS